MNLVQFRRLVLVNRVKYRDRETRSCSNVKEVKKSSEVCEFHQRWRGAEGKGGYCLRRRARPFRQWWCGECIFGSRGRRRRLRGERGGGGKWRRKWR